MGTIPIPRDSCGSRCTGRRFPFEGRRRGPASQAHEPTAVVRRRPRDDRGGRSRDGVGCSALDGGTGSRADGSLLTCVYGGVRTAQCPAVSRRGWRRRELRRGRDRFRAGGAGDVAVDRAHRGDDGHLASRWRRPRRTTLADRGAGPAWVLPDHRGRPVVGPCRHGPLAGLAGPVTEHDHRRLRSTDHPRAVARCSTFPESRRPENHTPGSLSPSRTCPDIEAFSATSTRRCVAWISSRFSSTRTDRSRSPTSLSRGGRADRVGPGLEERDLHDRDSPFAFQHVINDLGGASGPDGGDP